MDNLPKDPMLLLSVVNMKLRDFYSSLYVMCEEMGIDKTEIVSTLKKIDYEYDAGTNRFV